MRLSVLLVAIVLLVGCGTSAEPGGREELAGRTFLSTAVTQEGQPHELEPETRIRLSFTDEELSASAGCNTIGGGYRVEDGRLIVDALRSTLIGCPEPLAAQDAWVTELLEGRPSVTVDGDELTLITATTTVSLLDRTVADPDRPLAGPEWQVDSLVSGNAVSSVPGEAEASLTFNEDGSVAVRTGCNTGRGRYVTGPGTVTISDVVLTRMACEDERGELERAVLEVIETPKLAVAIEASSLTLTAGEKGLRLHAR